MEYKILETIDLKCDWTRTGFFGLDTIVVSAIGWVNTTGWSNPKLINGSFEGPTKDGVIEFDFIASAPTGIVHQTKTRIAAIVALYVPDWVTGVAIVSSSNRLEKMLPANKAAEVAIQDGLPVPWPFPWFRNPPHAG